MEEGTGISLYILVGSILFGLFAVMAATFGTELQAQTSNIVACVQSYVLNEPTDCWESDSEDLGESITPNDIRLGPDPDVWEHLTQNERKGIKDAYINTLMQDFPGFEDTYYHEITRINGHHAYYGAIYGVFDDSGTLIKSYSMGHTEDSKRGPGSDRDGTKHIRVNDIRLVPEEFIQKSNVYEYDLYYLYSYINEQGVYERYTVFK